MSFFDILLAGAIAEGMARRAMQEAARPPPENFFEIPPSAQAWDKVLKVSKEDNMVICVELTDDSHPPSRRIQPLFMDLAREVEKIPFFRAKVTETFSFAALREDLGGIKYSPTIAVAFFPDSGIAVKFVEGEENIKLALRTGSLHREIKQFMEQRIKLKVIERVTERLLVGAIAANMMHHRQQQSLKEVDGKESKPKTSDDDSKELSQLAKNLKDTLDLSGRKN